MALKSTTPPLIEIVVMVKPPLREQVGFRAVIDEDFHRSRGDTERVIGETFADLRAKIGELTR